MNLGTDQRPTTPGDVVPMINVAFLLLIFFLVMARMAPPDPLVVEPPRAEGETFEEADALYASASGALAFGPLTGDAALAAAARTEGTLTLRADARLDASDFARLLSRLTEAGVGTVNLSTVSP